MQFTVSFILHNEATEDKLCKIKRNFNALPMLLSKPAIFGKMQAGTPTVHLYDPFTFNLFTIIEYPTAGQT